MVEMTPISPRKVTASPAKLKVEGILAFRILDHHTGSSGLMGDLVDSSKTVTSRFGHVSAVIERVFDELENWKYSLGSDEFGGCW